jgi:hypothetical protein
MAKPKLTKMTELVEPTELTENPPVGGNYPSGTDPKIYAQCYIGNVLNCHIQQKLEIKIGSSSSSFNVYGLASSEFTTNCTVTHSKKITNSSPSNTWGIGVTGKIVNCVVNLSDVEYAGSFCGISNTGSVANCTVNCDGVITVNSSDFIGISDNAIATNCTANYSGKIEFIKPNVNASFHGITRNVDAFDCIANYSADIVCDNTPVMTNMNLFYGITSAGNAINCTANYTGKIILRGNGAHTFYGISSNIKAAINCIANYGGMIEISNSSSPGGTVNPLCGISNTNDAINCTANYTGDITVVNGNVYWVSKSGKAMDCTVNFDGNVDCDELCGISYEGNVSDCIANFTGNVTNGLFCGISEKGNATNCIVNCKGAITSMEFYGITQSGLATDCTLKCNGPITVENPSILDPSMSTTFCGCCSSVLGGNKFIAKDDNIKIIDAYGNGIVLPFTLPKGISRYLLATPNKVGSTVKINGLKITDENMYDELVVR